MRNFIFELVLLLGVVGYDSKKIVVKRHLAERFTNNPFFLRHIVGGGDYENYEIGFPLGHFLTEADPYPYKPEEEEDEELPKFLWPVVAKDDQIHSTEETKTETEEQILPILPFSDKIANFRSQHKEQKFLQTDSNDVDHTLLVFKKLPHFHRLKIFNEGKAKSVVPIAETQTKELGHLTKKERNLTKATLGKNPDALYIFRSLPHFKSTNVFRGKEENVFVSKNLEKKTKPIVQNQNKEAQVAYAFSSLPHFETGRKFQELAPIQMQQLSKDFANLDLPHSFHNKPEKKNQEPNLLLSSTEATRNGGPTLFVSKLAEEDEGFKSLPKFEVANFHAIQLKRRRTHRVVKKKKRVEFGRRLQPKVNGIAGLPLADNGKGSAINSYGNSLTQKLQ